ncbi:hypothetical protein, partial [Butyribacter intestini]|uniref:hypothetical protein n=1 Tax=Butyribacter intestini TaxID=1703332 RepID=UPI003AF16D5F
NTGFLTFRTFNPPDKFIKPRGFSAVMAQYAHNEHIHLIIIKRLIQNVNSFYEIRTVTLFSCQ